MSGSSVLLPYPLVSGSIVNLCYYLFPGSKVFLFVSLPFTVSISVVESGFVSTALDFCLSW